MSLLNATADISMSTAQTLTVDAQSREVLVPVTPNVAQEFKRNPRTIKRWIADPAFNFPKPVRINGRLYIARSELEGFKQRVLASALKRAGA